MHNQLDLGVLDEIEKLMESRLGDQMEKPHGVSMEVSAVKPGEAPPEEPKTDGSGVSMEPTPELGEEHGPLGLHELEGGEKLDPQDLKALAEMWESIGQ